MLKPLMLTVKTQHVYHRPLVFITSPQTKPVTDGGLLPRAERQNGDSGVEMRASWVSGRWEKREETVEKWCRGQNTEQLGLCSKWWPVLSSLAHVSHHCFTSSICFQEQSLGHVSPPLLSFAYWINLIGCCQPVIAEAFTTPRRMF